MAGLIPSDTVDEIKRRVSLVSLIGEYVNLKKAGRSHKGLCPFHGEKSASFHVHDDLGYYYCFGCGAKGDCISFLQEQVGYSFIESVQQLAERCGVILPEVRERPGDSPRARQKRRESKERWYDVNRLAMNYFETQLKAHPEAMTYLKDTRGLTFETLETYHVGYAPESWDGLSKAVCTDFQAQRDAHAVGLIQERRGNDGFYDRFRHRVIFPVFALAGKVCGFAGRTLSKEKDVPKYVNSSESEIFTKGRELYGLFQARKSIRDGGRAIMVEGQVDVLTMAQAGFQETVAPMGTALTPEQCQLLKRFTKHAVLIYDGDTAGRAAALKAIPMLLSVGVGGSVVMMPDGQDPDTFLREFGAPAMGELIANGRPLFDVVVDEAMHSFDGSVQSKARVAQQIAPVFALLEARQERDVYTRLLAQRLRVLEDEMARWLGPSARSEQYDDMPMPTGGGPEARGASRNELDLMKILLQRPDLLPSWEERDGKALVTNERVSGVLDKAAEMFDLIGRVDGAELLSWMEAQGWSQAARKTAGLMAEEDPFRDDEEAMQAFSELMDKLQVRAAARVKHRDRAALMSLPIEEQLKVLAAEYAK